MCTLHTYIDCRNQYESEMGTFKGAIPLSTRKFGETWSVLESVLRDVPTDRRILTFCTGGIRCVKVNAYLQQKLGFTNVGRLEKGIIAYERWLQQNRQQEKETGIMMDVSPSGCDATFDLTKARSDTEVNLMGDGNFFKGVNYLFDQRRLSK